MKNILFSGFFALLSVMFIVAGVANASNGNDNAAKRCYVAAFASVAIPAVAGAKFQRMQELCFVNKSFFQATDNPWTRGEIALMQFMAQNAKGQTQADAQGGRLKMETYARAFRFEIPDANSGNRELLNAATLYTDGVIPEEWDRGQLPDGWNIAVTHIGLGFVADGTVTAPLNAIALASLPNSWPAVLRNGKLKFSQAGAVKQQIDCLYTGTMAASFGRIGEDDAAELDTPFILEERKATKFELLGAGTAAFASPAGGNFLELRLRGVFVRPRA
jgi:hypothetical protein